MQDGDELGRGIAVHALLLHRHAVVELAADHPFDSGIDAAPEAEQAGAGIGRIVRAARGEGDRRARFERRQQPLDQHRVRQPVRLQGLLVPVDRHSPGTHVLEAGIGGKGGETPALEAHRHRVGERDRRGERRKIERQDVQAACVRDAAQRRRFRGPAGAHDDMARRFGEQQAHEFEADPRGGSGDEMDDGHFFDSG